MSRWSLRHWLQRCLLRARWSSRRLLACRQGCSRHCHYHQHQHRHNHSHHHQGSSRIIIILLLNPVFQSSTQLPNYFRIPRFFVQTIFRAKSLSIEPNYFQTCVICLIFVQQILRYFSFFSFFYFQVGVIRPISREAQDAGPMPKVGNCLMVILLRWWWWWLWFLWWRWW